MFELLLGRRRVSVPPPLPREILHEIFKLAIPLSFSLNPLLDKDEGPYDREKNYAWINSMKIKLSISYVCKLWNLAAKPFLYQDIAFKTRPLLPCFIRTVEQRPEYGYWAKTLTIYATMYGMDIYDGYDDKLGRNVEQILFKCPNLIGLAFMSTPSYGLYRIKWVTRPLPPITHLSVTINHPNILETVKRFQDNLVSLSISIDCPHDLIHRPISLPLLKTLSISVKNKYHLDRVTESIRVILYGISKLQNLVYECLHQSPPDHFPPRFLLSLPYRVSSHLRSLSISTNPNQHLSRHNLQTILDACPKLEHLAIHPASSTLRSAHHPTLRSLDLGTPFDYTQFMLGTDLRKYQDLPYFPSLQRRRLLTLRSSETRFFLPISLSLPLEQIHSDCDAFRMDFQEVRLRHRRGHVCIAGKALKLYPVPRTRSPDDYETFGNIIVVIVPLVLIGTLTAWGALLLLKLLK